MSTLLNNPKKLIYFLVIILISVGAINVLSASYLESGYSYFVKHFMYGIFGFCVMYFVSKRDYRVFLRSNWLQFFYIGVLVLLLLVDAIGAVNKGAQRWLYLGPVSIQPSEVAKLIVVMMSAKVLGNMLQRGEHISLISGKGSRCFLATLVLSGLVYVQPDLGTAAIIFALMLCVFIVAGIRKQEIFTILGVGMAGAVLFTLSTPYRLERIKVWFDPWLDEVGAGYQMVLSLLTIGSGGLIGADWGQGSGKYLYLPESHTDFAFAVFCQEDGFIGAAVIIILFLLLGCAFMKIALTTKDKRGFLLVTGVSFLVVGQAIANMAMVCGIFPVIGVPLVFISYGGTSMAVSMAAIGLALSVYNTEEKQRCQEDDQQQASPQVRRSDLRMVGRRRY